MRPHPLLSLLSIVLLASCSPAPLFGYPDDRASDDALVRQDVTAIIEGMAMAHGAQRVVLRGPDDRLLHPSSEQN